MTIVRNIKIALIIGILVPVGIIIFEIKMIKHGEEQMNRCVSLGGTPIPQQKNYSYYCLKDGQLVKE
jgi:hypothetical protein